MQILYLDTLESTQTYLKHKLQNNVLQPPIAICAHEQTNGLGSRDNSWNGYKGNLFLSFAINLKDLPNDLKLESASIYFAYILKDTLAKENSKLFLKWPNDFYVDGKKIGGMITNIVGDNLICGVGLNLVKAPKEFKVLDIAIDKKNLLDKYFKNLENNYSWKQIFSKYELEFYGNKFFYTHNNNHKILLKDAKLQSDGSIIINDERIYSLR